MYDLKINKTKSYIEILNGDEMRFMNFIRF